MLPRWCLTTLVFALPILAISFGALLGTAELMRALGDVGGAHAMRWVAILALLLLVIDGLCLLTVLGLTALANQSERDEEP
jgi:hypothetical protein